MNPIFNPLKITLSIIWILIFFSAKLQAQSDPGFCDRLDSLISQSDILKDFGDFKIVKEWQEVNSLFGDTTLYKETDFKCYGKGSSPVVLKKLWGQYSSSQVIRTSPTLVDLKRDHFNLICEDVNTCMAGKEGWKKEITNEFDDWEINLYRLEYKKSELFGLRNKVVWINLMKIGEFTDNPAFQIQLKVL